MLDVNRVFCLGCKRMVFAKDYNDAYDLCINCKWNEKLKQKRRRT